MSSNTLKISVIVPVYNVEQYLEECIESIINQDYENLEIILINDGSTDSSPQICERYAEKDNRIIFINQENAGVSAARNKGLDVATGDLINFIDSDDWINPGMYSFFIQHINNNIDVLYMPSNMKKNITSGIYSQSEIRAQLIKYFIGYNKVKCPKMAPVWSLCIRRSLISNMRFQKINIAEDKLFFIEAMLRAKNVYISPRSYYNYRPVENSATRRYLSSYAYDVTNVNAITWGLLNQYGANNNELLKLYNNATISYYLHVITNEAKNPELNIPNKSLQSYYTNNEVHKLLTWNKVLKEIPNKPKLLFVKLGLTNYLLKSKRKKHYK